MRAIVCDGYGAPADVLRLGDTVEPAVAADEVLVRVHAASVNAADWHLIRGVPYVARLSVGLRRPGFVVPGSDFAGRVEAVGADATTLRTGDDVFGTTFMHGFGAFGERLAVSESLVARKPENVSFEAAAAVPLAASTALQGLRDHGRLTAGQRVLVIGASGGVGSFAVQLAKTLGAHVTGVCGVRSTDLVRSLGADDVVAYDTGDPYGRGDRYDLILQAGGEAPASRLRPLLGAGGTLVQISGDSRNRWVGPLGRIAGARLVSRLAGPRVVSFTVRPNRADLAYLAGLLERGDVTPVLGRSYALADAPAAIGEAEAGRTSGKVLVTVA